MSAKVVRKLLQQTSDLGLQRPQNEDEVKHSRRKRRKVDLPAVDQKDIVEQQVRSMLFLDGQMTLKGGKQEKTIKRIESEQQKVRKAKKKSGGLILGNSRGSSSQMRSILRLPTP